MACCTTCGHAHDLEANFCSRCGRPTSPMPSGDRRVVTVLFADVSGFTSLSETLDPERLTEIINAYFKALSESVYRFGGIVDKYIGDAIMALFGAPLAHEDDAERAVSAAYAMQRAAEQFSDALHAETGIRLRLRIGLNTGLVVAGAVGGDQKRDYTVMGDAVNLAQRLESLAEPGTILVSGQTYRLTAHAFSYQSARKLFVKGRQEAVYAYELKGPQLDPPPHADRSPFLGRRHELATLLAAFAAAKSLPQWIVLSGPAGSGKSRLAREAIALLPPDPARLLIEARGHAFHSDSPFSLLRQIVEAMMAPMRQGEALDRLEAGLEARAVPNAFEASRKLAFFLGLEGSDPETAQDTLDSILADLGRPLILLLEDLHCTDPDSAAWLARLGNRRDLGSIAVLCEAREASMISPPPNTPPPNLSLVMLTLPPLERTEAWQLVLAELKTSPDGLDPSARSLLEAAAMRSGGNPMFIRELLNSWIEGGILKRIAGRWASDPQDDFSLPTSIKALIAARLDQIPRPLREILEVASALEGRFSAALLGAIVGTPDVETMIAELLRRDLLRLAEETSLIFSQSLIQEVTYQTMLLSRRRELHQRIASLLEARKGDIESLARHYRLAEDAEHAVPYLVQAALRAQGRASHSSACQFLRQALALYPRDTSLALPPRSDLLRSLADSAAVLGLYDEALSSARLARDMLGDSLAIAQIERTLGNLHERLGDYAKAAEHYAEAARRSPEESLRNRVQLDLAWLALRQGDHDACLAACSQVLRHAEADVDALGMAHSLRGVAYDRLGRWQDASSAHRAALNLRIRRRDRFGMASSLNNWGMALTELGDWPEAERLYNRSLKLYERIGDPSRASAVRNNLGDLAARRGNLEAAEKLHREALSRREKLGDRFGVGASHCALGWVIALKGDLDEGGKLIRDGVAILEAIGERELLAEAYQALGRIALEGRRYPEAEARLAKALGLSHFDRNPLQRAIVHRLRGQLRLELGDMAGARDEIMEAARMLEGLSHPLERARTQVLRSRLLRAEGRCAEATAMLSMALMTFERLGAHRDRALASLEDSPPDPLGGFAEAPGGLAR